MQRGADIMTRDVVSVAPQESVQRAAQMMDELNVGALPVCDGERVTRGERLGVLVAEDPDAGGQVAGDQLHALAPASRGQVRDGEVARDDQRVGMVAAQGRPARRERLLEIQVREDRRREGSRHELRDVQDADALERARPV